MKLTLLRVIRSFLVDCTNQLLELFFRSILLLTPVFIYTLLIQLSDKPTLAKEGLSTNLNNYLTKQSTYSFIAPGVIVVCLDGSEYKTFLNSLNTRFKKSFPVFLNSLKVIAYISVVLIAFLIYTYFTSGHVSSYFR